MKLNNERFMMIVGTILMLTFCIVCLERYEKCYRYGGWYCVFKG